jgi:hypothetical protein
MTSSAPIERTTSRLPVRVAAPDHVAYHLRPPSASRKGEFEFVLDLILDGLERARDAG